MKGILAAIAIILLVGCEMMPSQASQQTHNAHGHQAIVVQVVKTDGKLLIRWSLRQDTAFEIRIEEMGKTDHYRRRIAYGVEGKSFEWDYSDMPNGSFVVRLDALSPPSAYGYSSIFRVP